MKKIIRFCLVVCAFLIMIVILLCKDSFQKYFHEQQPPNLIQLMNTQALELEGVMNARQLGGYITSEGRTVKYGLILRTGRLVDLTDDDQQVLVERYHLRDIIDLRTDTEVEAAMDPELNQVTYTHASIFMQEDMELLNSAPSSTMDSSAWEDIEDPKYKLYIMLGGNKEAAEDYFERRNELFFKQQAFDSFGQLLHILLEEKEGAVLFHCSQGKDRTGFAAAIILGLLNVDRETIIADFLLSNQFYETQIQSAVLEARDAGYPEEYQEFLRNLLGVSEKDITSFLNKIEDRYGSMRTFATTELGITDQEIDKLIDKYTEKD